MLLKRLLFTALAVSLTASLAAAQPPYLTQWGSFGAGAGQFDLPWGIAVNQNNGEVFVVDQNNHRVQVFDADGNFLRQFGSQGAGGGQFDLPYGIAVDAIGDVYVTEIGNSRVQKLNPAGVPLWTIGSIGSGNGQFNTPSGILVHSSGDIYVSDGLNHRVQRFSAAGAFLGKWGSFGSPAGQFRIPMGIAEDADGNLFVCDQGNHRVQKFTPTGGFLGQFGTRGQGDEQFSFPQGIAIDGSGNIYVADMANFRMKQYDALGNWVVNWGSMGSGDGQFNWPLGVAVDANDNVYVTELDNSRVQKFGVPSVAPVTLTAYLDVLPGRYPNIIVPESNEPVSVALLGSSDFDISRIRTASVTLNGRKPYVMALGDVGTSYPRADDCQTSAFGDDGYDDLIFRFRTDDILTAFPAWQDGQTRLLRISGTFDDGTAFASTDCVVLRFMPVTTTQIGGEADFVVATRAPEGAGRRIEYTVPEAARVQFGVYDVTGRRITTLLDEWAPAGGHVLNWNAAGLPSGVYFVRMNVGEKSVVRRVSLQR